MRVFISHSASDRGFAEHLAQVLSQRGVEVWTNAEVRPGESWISQLRTAIETADAIIPVLSSRFAKSQWAEFEVSAALADRLSGGTKKIIPVLAEKGAEPPFFLKDVQWADLSSDELFSKNIDSVLQALNAGDHPISSQAKILDNRKDAIELQKWLLEREKLKLNHLGARRTSLIYYVMGIGALLATIACIGVLVWGKTGVQGVLLVNIIVALVSTVAGIIAGVFSAHLSRESVEDLERMKKDCETLLRGLKQKHEQTAGPKRG